MEFNPSTLKVPRFFNTKRNLDKAISGLIGILSGVAADKQLSSVELLYLNLWLKAQHSLKDDPDAIDLIDLIEDIVEDGVVTEDEMEDLVTLCNDIADIRAQENVGEYESKVNEFLGLLQGIIADGIVNKNEFQYVCSWIKTNEIIAEDWVVKQVSQRIDDILSDDIVTDEELAEFTEVLKQLTGYQFDESGDAECASIAYLEDPINRMDDGCTVCFTGTFLTGTRRTIEDIAKSVGHEPQKSVTKKLNFLVVGELISPDWRFQSYGRKIEKAVQLRSEGLPIRILTEKTWSELIQLS